MFKVHDLFTEIHPQIRPLFESCEYAWEPLLKLKSYFKELPLGQIDGYLEDGVHLVNPESIFIGKGTRVESGAYIVGPCFIGENCEIRHTAYLRGYVLTGNKVVIGHATEAKHAIFLDGAQAGHFAYVGDSILGHKVNLGAGTKCANLRFDHGNIFLDGQDTGLRKLGALMGDFSQTGCNAVSNPGTVFQKHAVVGPCRSVQGVIKSLEKTTV
jgi:NDP-sugar pyrophosphorylase family protein